MLTTLNLQADANTIYQATENTGNMAAQIKKEGYLDGLKDLLGMSKLHTRLHSLAPYKLFNH